MHVQLDWLLSPITLYSASSVCLLTSLTLVVRAKLHPARAGSLSIMPEVIVRPQENSDVQGLKAEMEQLRESVSRLEEALPVRGTGVGLNVSKRAVALRMHRRGEQLSTIASALETPANEIALLIKLQGMAG